MSKLFTEAIENIDMKPIDGVRSAGGAFVHVVRFGALPRWQRWAVYEALILTIAVLGEYDARAFIYFQF